MSGNKNSGRKPKPDGVRTSILLSEVRKEADAIAAAMRELFSHLPPGEIDDDEELRFGLDEQHKRFVIIRMPDDIYWLEPGYTCRHRSGVKTYFKNGQAYSSPPPSDN